MKKIIITVVVILLAVILFFFARNDYEQVKTGKDNRSEQQDLSSAENNEKSPNNQNVNENTSSDQIKIISNNDTFKIEVGEITIGDHLQRVLKAYTNKDKCLEKYEIDVSKYQEATIYIRDANQAIIYQTKAHVDYDRAIKNDYDTIFTPVDKIENNEFYNQDNLQVVIEFSDCSLLV